MNDEKLRKLLEELQDEIDRTESKDEKGRALLRELRADIQAYLESPESEQGRVQESLGVRLREALDHFEITHPALTMLLSEMSRILSNAGI